MPACQRSTSMSRTSCRSCGPTANDGVGQRLSLWTVAFPAQRTGVQHSMRCLRQRRDESSMSLSAGGSIGLEETFGT
jgi:hypothetical protein